VDIRIVRKLIKSSRKKTILSRNQWIFDGLLTALIIKEAIIGIVFIEQFATVEVVDRKKCEGMH